jgi:hypothetical protein
MSTQQVNGVALFLVGLAALILSVGSPGLSRASLARDVWRAQA